MHTPFALETLQAAQRHASRIPPSSVLLIHYEPNSQQYYYAQSQAQLRGTQAF